MICLLLLILTGCGVSRAASRPTAASTAESAASEPVSETAQTETVPPETEPAETEPAETEPAETVAPTEPPTLADCVEMVLPASLKATPDCPTTEVTVGFPRVELPATDRICSLTLELDGELCASWPELELTADMERKTELSFSFCLRDEDRDAVLLATLQHGDQVLRRGAVISVDNDTPEVHYAKSGESRPYYIEVLRNQNVVIVYGLENGEYSFPVKTWLCSTGRATPYGHYNLGGKQEWGALFGGVWGQYVCGIYGNILFHSVPYYYRAKDRLKTAEYNKLGTAASMGCVRLPVEGAKWIFDNCPYGTRIYIYDTEELPVKRPEAVWLDPEDPRSCWDPTDPDPENPWHIPNLHPDREEESADTGSKYGFPA